MDDSAQVTRLLQDWAGGNQQAMDELVPLVYDTLRRLAIRHLSAEYKPITLQPTALVHEAYLKLVDQGVPDFQSRSHFFGIAARLMRQVLVDHSRAKKSQKRGGDAVRVTLDDAGQLSTPQGADVVDLHDALEALAQMDERKSRIIELRYFGGLTEEETAESIGISVATVRRDTRLAEAWLYSRMQHA